MSVPKWPGGSPSLQFSGTVIVPPGGNVSPFSSETTRQSKLKNCLNGRQTVDILTLVKLTSPRPRLVLRPFGRNIPYQTSGLEHTFPGGLTWSSHQAAPSPLHHPICPFCESLSETLWKERTLPDVWFGTHVPWGPYLVQPPGCSLSTPSSHLPFL